MKNFWCEVYLNNIQNNLNKIKELSNGKKTIAVIKGDAYGLGIEGISEAINNEVTMFAVADLKEAEKVRTDKDILLLTPMVTASDFNCNMDNIVYTIDNEDILDELHKETDARIHIYINTGMNRMGIEPKNLSRVIERIEKEFVNLKIEGIYSHLHNTKDEKYTLNQVNIFKNIVESFKDKVKYIHLMNSAGFLNNNVRKACEFTNAVRIGNVIYGYDGLNLGFKKAYKYRAKPINKHFVKKGEQIGYGCAYKTKKDMFVGILGFGNIESFGFSKEIKHNIFYDILKVIYNHIKFRPVIFNGNKGVRILGRANMNSTLIDMEGIELDNLLTVDVSPILADSSIEKIYVK